MQEIAVGPSRILAVVLVLAHSVGGGLLWATDLSLAWKPAVLPFFLWSLVKSVRCHAGRLSPSAVVGVSLKEEGRAAFQRRDGQIVEGVLLASSFVSPWLTVLNLRPVERRFFTSVVILPDAVEQAAFRRLRVLLRWKYSQAKPG